MTTKNPNGEQPSPATGFGTATTDGPPSAAPAPGSDPSQTGEQPGAGEGASTQGEYQIPQTLLGEDGKIDTAKLTEHLQAQDTAQAALVEKYGEVPEGDYAMPTGITDADGNEISIDADNPILQEMLPAFREMGIGQKGVDQLLSAYAKAALSDVTAATESVLQSQQEAVQAEIQSLGDQGPTRIKSVVAQVSEAVSPEAASALINSIQTKAAFEALEAFLEKGRSAEGRVPETPPAQQPQSREQILYSEGGTA